MSPEAADALAKRIINLWRGGPPLTEWRELLTTLDEGRAGTALVRLRNELTDPPSIARFRSEYKSIHGDPPHRGIGEHDCHWCQDTGWTETAPLEAHGGHVYTGWKPCTRCDEGRTRETSETWTKSPVRRFVSDDEAQRLTLAVQQRHAPRKEKA
jgi:hypothetical protein